MSNPEDMTFKEQIQTRLDEANEKHEEGLETELARSVVIEEAVLEIAAILDGRS